MKKLFTLTYLLLSIIAFSLIPKNGYSQISLTTANGSYSQNFDGMAATINYPTGWSGIRYAGTGTVNASLSPVVDNGTSTSGNVFNDGITGAADRALGTLASGSTVPAFGTSFTNNTGTAISGFSLTAFSEQWRTGTNNTVNETVIFEYSTDATSLSTGTWTAVTSLNLVELQTATTAGVALDGNAAANRIAISGAISSLNISTGNTIWFRWRDIDAAGSDGNYALDDFQISYTNLSSTVSVASGINASEPSTNGTFTINFSTPTTTATAINFALTGTATFTSDYSVAYSTGTTPSTTSTGTLTVPSGTSSVTVNILTVNDILIEGTEVVTLTLSSPTQSYVLGTATANINLVDDDAPTVSVAGGSNASEPAANGTFTVSFNPTTSTSTDINFAYTGTATFASDYSVSYLVGSTSSTTSTGTLTVPSGTSSVTVTIAPIDDVTIEGTETIILTISTPTQSYTLGTTSGSINLLDNDVLTNVSVSAGASAAEPATNGTFNIILTSPAPAGGVTINYSLSGTASQNVDYTDPQNGSVTIPQGSSSAIVTLNVMDDNILESTETIIITLISASNGFTFTGTTATINLTDDDVLQFNGSYTQDFNSLVNTGTNIPWANNSTIPGWYSSRLTYIANDGFLNSGSLYSFGTTGSTERALGSIGSGTTGTVFYGVRFKNNTGAPITNLQISYTGEQWRNGGNITAQTVNFAYQTSTTVTSITTGTWTAVPSLNFTSPTVGVTATQLDGNAVENSTNITFNLSGLNIPAGNEFFLRWEDIDHTSNDHGLGIDNLLVTNVICAAPTAAATALVFGGITDTTIAASFTASSPATDSYLIVMSTNSTLINNPANGQTYNIGDNVGDGSVISKGTTTSFTATGLNALTTYFFFVFPMNALCTGGPLYYTTNVLTGSATTIAGLPPCAAPSSQPTNLTFGSATTNSISGSFTATTADQYLVVRSSSSLLGADPANTVSYNTGDVLGNGVVVQRNSSTSFTATGLTPNTTYFFFVFSLNNQACINGPAYNINAPLTANQSTIPLPPCTTPTAQGNALSLATSNIGISGTFTGVSDADNYLIIKSTSATLGATPTDNTDYNAGDVFGNGTVLINTTSTTFYATALTPNTTYYFFIFAANKTCSGGTKYATQPALSGNITTTTGGANNYYFGTLHSHSDYSDGNADNPGFTPAQNYAYAKNSLCMDYLGISEHNHFSTVNNPGNQVNNYHQGSIQANNFTSTNTNFLAMYGMEWGVISGGGHVVIYGDGMDDLWGWESGSGAWGASNNYDVFVPKSIYRGATGLFKTVNDNIASKTFATLAHPNLLDYNKLDTSYDAIADNAIVGTAVESGPAFSTNTTYTDPSIFNNENYLFYFKTLLSKGYHVGPTIDHDNHNTTFGRTTTSRTAVIAPGLTKTSFVNAMRNMNFYATQDCDTKVDFTINTKIMGSTISDRFGPNIYVALTDATTSVSGAIIRIMYGAPGSGVTAVKIDSAIGSTLSFTDNTLANMAKGYYYLDITNGTSRIVTSPIWYTRNDGLSALPVKLNSFSVQKANTSTQLNWSTDQEINSSYFSIEKSADGRNWKSISRVNAAGNSSTVNSYRSFDNNPFNGINYYRLKQFDVDGKFEYSVVKSLSFSKIYNITVAPNPAKDFINVTTTKNQNTILTIQLVDVSGKVLKSLQSTQPLVKISTAGIAKGLYFIKVKDENSVQTQRVIIE